MELRQEQRRLSVPSRSSRILMRASENGGVVLDFQRVVLPEGGGVFRLGILAQDPDGDVHWLQSSSSVSILMGVPPA